MIYKEDLLETLRTYSGFTYLSDLHNPDNAGIVYKTVQQVEETAYFPCVWRETIHYILKVDYQTDNAGDAKNYLLEKLSKRASSSNASAANK